MNQKEKNVYRVVSAVADKHSVTFYLDDGNVIIVKQTDPRLNKILELIIPITMRGRVAVVSLTDFSVYEEFSKKTNGFVKFFSVAKNKITSFFKEPEEVKLPSIKKGENKPILTVKTTSKDIIKEAKQIPAMDNITPDETVIAVIGDTIIPDVEKIYPFISRSLHTNSTKSIENFLKRLVPVMEKRAHSVQDVFRFLENADLPLAEDGSIIAYKILKNYNDESDVFVDCHTGRVIQRVGSKVIVDESLVDPNRSRECSNGIHVARRDYIRDFSGNVCTLIKLAPEDIIAVPHNDPRKVRTTGYHIIGLISNEAYASLKVDKHMTNHKEAQILLANAISGNHPDPIEEVRIHGQMGTHLEIIPLIKDNKKKVNRVLNKADINKAKSLDDEVGAKEETSPKQLNKQVAKERKKIAKEEAKVINATSLYIKWAKSKKNADFTALIDFKKKKKQSWLKLGLDKTQISKIESKIKSK